MSTRGWRWGQLLQAGKSISASEQASLPRSPGSLARPGLDTNTISTPHWLQQQTWGGGGGQFCDAPSLHTPSPPPQNVSWADSKVAGLVSPWNTHPLQSLPASPCPTETPVSPHPLSSLLSPTTPKSLLPTPAGGGKTLLTQPGGVKSKRRGRPDT